MTLVINTTIPEGIVLASDSRQSYRNRKGVSRVGSDSARKLILINDRIAVALSGLAFLEENNIPKNISKFIEQFKREVDIEQLSVSDVADKLHYLFNKKYRWEEQLVLLPDKITADLTNQGFKGIKITKEKDRILFTFEDKDGNVNQGVAGVDGLSLMVAGYNKDESLESYIVNIPGEVIKTRDSHTKGMEYGANWIGQTDVVSRIIKGWDPRIFNAPLIAESIKAKGQKEVENQLNGLEYAINWGTMTLQDAIDFSVLAIETTAAIQRFSDGIQADPGDIPGVGGPVDVLVLTQDGPRWIKQKELRSE